MKGTLARLILLSCLATPIALDAQEAGSKAGMARDLGAVLAWRLGPVMVEEKCRGIDVHGEPARAQALKTWQEKNARLISAVDVRVREVLAKAFPAATPEDAMTKVSSQIKGLLAEEIFADASPEEMKKICRAESDPAGSRWNSNGLPHVQGSLAALYDWLVQQK